MIGNRALSALLALGTVATLVQTAGCGGDGDGDSGSGASSGSGGPGQGGSIVITPSCNGVSGDDTAIETALPKLPELANVQACTGGDAVNVTFDPLDDAVDYRIYPLPADGDITTDPLGNIIVKNALYRCAGHREALYMVEDILNPDEGWNDNSAGGATVLHHDVEGFTRADDDAKLGYVYRLPGADRLPVYVLGTGDLTLASFFECGRPIFNSTRPKTYTTDSKKRDELIAGGARDDGIAFYVPKAGGSGTKPVFEGTFGDGDVLRWVDGPEGSARGQGTKIFDALESAGKDTIPLMRVHVVPYCAKGHDELVGGMARFKKVRSEGDQPLTALRWSGITEDTVLVVEALDGGCPYQGMLSPEHVDAFTEEFGGTVLEYEAFLTPDDMRKKSPTGEVFINGQHDTDTLPKAIARTFVRVAPNEPDMDYVATFPVSEANGVRSSFKAPVGTVYAQTFAGKDFDFSSYNASHVYFGSMLGEFWVAYNDIAADVNGKVRLTPHEKATMADDSYLHVSTEVDIISTGRRYPQIIISDQDIPVQENLEKGRTIIVQPKDYTPSMIQVQLCDHRTWDVNAQCPMIPVFVPEAPHVSQLPGELTATDNAVKIDVYASTQRVYLMLNDKPYACADFNVPADDGAVYPTPKGAVTVTWGDVLYHSGVDFATGGGEITGNSYLFHRTHMHLAARRHFDNLGFSSNGPRPAWDEKRIPCVTAK